MRLIQITVYSVALLAALVMVAGPTKSTHGYYFQDKGSLNKSGGFDFGGLDIGGFVGDPYEFEASYEAEKDSNKGKVHVTVTLQGHFHIFSTTHSAGGPEKTVITLAGDDAKLAGPFVPDSDPDIVTDTPGFEGLRIEQHSGKVTWTAPITFNKPLGDKPGKLTVVVNGQVCDENCRPLRDLKVDAPFSKFIESSKKSETGGTFREPSSPVEWTVQLSKGSVQPGERVELILTAKPDEDFHVYKHDPQDPVLDSRTLIVLTKKAQIKARAAETNSKLESHDFGIGEVVYFYPGEVTWRIPIEIPSGSIEEGTYPLEGLIGYQACTKTSCDQPRGIKFSLEYQVGKKADNAQPVNATMQAIKFNEVKQHPALKKWIDGPKIALTLSPWEILTKFCLAMLGGFILNFMPCVLPVIGLKILGFVNEAGGSKAHASFLTVVYAMGMITLILGLGCVSVIVRMTTEQSFGWGEQFGSAAFSIALTAFMFALALSFLGVWEIPIPGFAMSKTSNSITSREGVVGAFSKGVITTLLATPCSAPFLGGVFAVAISQPGWLVMLIFLGVGLGMALPYFAIAAWPSALRLLPKPGPWMETFKELLAFPMLLSVVFFVSGFPNEERIAMMSSLMFVWFACWIIGRVPAWAESGTKFRTWALGTVVGVVGTFGSFYWLKDSDYELEWIPYNEQKLDQLVADGNTVMIDFTANWCGNCKTNLAVAIQTAKVKELVEKNGVIPMVADMTRYPPDIKQKLQELNSNSIPVLAIYPPRETEKPIVMPDILTESQVLDALTKAGPSKTEATKPTALETRDNSDVR